MEHAELESIIVCLIVVGIVAGAVYIVCGHLLHQSWASLAAAVIFVIGAVLCIL